MSSGSTSATCAPISGVPPTLNLIFRSGSVMTAHSVASLPVPAVVGTATSGGMRLVIGVPPYSYSRIEPPCATSTPAAFAVSIELPPPSATSPSQPDSRYAALARPTSSMSGFGRTSSKTTAPPRCASVALASPAETTPGSVTSRGRVTPRPATSSPTCAIAPAPWTMRVGTSTARTAATSTLTGRRAYRNVSAAKSALGDLELAADVEACTLLEHVRGHRAPALGLDLGQPEGLTRLGRVPDRDPDDLVAVARVALVRAQHPLGELRRPPRARELVPRAGL